MRELHTGKLYWPDTMPQPQTYTRLSQNTTAQVAVIGGGMSGVICAHELTAAGIPTILAERGNIAGGSTLANTGLIQFCNDIMLHELAGEIGQARAELFYRSCKQAVEALSAAAIGLARDVGWKQRSCLYYASTEQDLPKLKREFEALSANGFDVEYWSADDIAHRFPFRKPGAIVTHGDAQINPLQFVCALAEQAAANGLTLYEHTDIEKHEMLPGGIHRLHSADGFTIDADHVVYAVGYEPEELRGKLIKANLNRSYCIVTNPQRNLDDWHGQYMIWETARPYLYIRTTEDGRVLIGGLDEEIGNTVHDKRHRQKKNKLLLEKLQALFPSFDLRIDYSWNAVFGESQDDLPFIGEDPAWPGVYYSLGYGGNGTVYSMLAAQLIADRIQGRSNPIAEIVSLNRLTNRQGAGR